MSEITSPIMLDETGQDLVAEAQNIVTKLQALINAVKPNAADIPLAAISGMTADDVQEGIAELNSNLSDLTTIKDFTVNHGTINAGASSTIYDSNMTKTNIAIIGIVINGNYNSDCVVWSYNPATTGFMSRVKNNGNNQASNIAVKYRYIEFN